MKRRSRYVVFVIEMPILHAMNLISQSWKCKCLTRLESTEFPAAFESVFFEEELGMRVDLVPRRAVKPKARKFIELDRLRACSKSRASECCLKQEMLTYAWKHPIRSGY